MIFVMLAADAYSPSQWHDFFVMLGGGTAALTGLVFVAMSLNLTLIVQDLSHRNRAMGTLAGFTSVFMISCLALLGNQAHVSLGLEWMTVAVIACGIYLYGYFDAARGGGSPAGLSLMRPVFGTGCYVVQIGGAALLVGNQFAGIYLAGAALVVLIPFTISGAWLLLVGVHQERLAQEPRA